MGLAPPTLNSAISSEPVIQNVLAPFVQKLPPLKLIDPIGDSLFG
jgi:hypothetical protein